MNKNYNSGRRFEYRVKEYLEKKGYYVMRSAGSKSPFDLIAVPSNSEYFTIFEGSILLIQCKHGTKITKHDSNIIKKLNDLLTSFTYCIFAYSKSHGKIEFYTPSRFKIGWL